jgi:hypothetical protein
MNIPPLNVDFWAGITSGLFIAGALKVVPNRAMCWSCALFTLFLARCQ